MLSFGTVESECNQVKAWPPPLPWAPNAIGCAEELLTAKTYGFSFTGFGSPAEAERTNNTLVQSHVNRVHTHIHTLSGSNRIAVQK